MQIIPIVKIIFLLAAMEVGGEVPSTPPAVIWGVKLKEPRNIFQTIKSKKFADRLRPLLKEHMLIAYFAPLLTSKDLSCQHPNCFAYLRKEEPRTYYSKIQDPLKAIETLLAEHKHELVWSERDQMLQLPCKKGHIYAYNFSTPNLTEHDKFMEAVASNLTACQLVQLYTGHGEHIEEIDRRIRRTDLAKARALVEHAIVKPEIRANISTRNQPVQNGSQTEQIVVLRHPKAIVTLSMIVYAQEFSTGVNVYYQREYIYMSHIEPSLDVVLKDPNNIMKGVALFINTGTENMRLILTPVVGNWRLNRIDFHNHSHTPRDLIFYSTTFSFCCQTLTAYSKSGGRLSLYSLSIDVVLADNGTAMDPDYIPKPCWLCVEYLTPALTQTIFTVAILLLMLGMGISTFFNMGQNSRMPNGNEPDPFVKSH